MDDRLALVESKIEALSRSLAEIEGRLAAVERAPAPGSELSEYIAPAAAAAGADVGTAPAGDLIGHLALVGRTLMVLAGAFLLRALTDGHVVPQAAGIALGLAYAVLWLLLGDRAAARERRLSAAFHAGSAVIVADPLLWEAVSRFGVLTPPLAAALLAAFTAGGLWVAWRRNLRPVAWLVSLGAIAASWASMISAQATIPYTAVLLALGAATLWLAYVRPWPGLRWLAAGAVDLAVVLLAIKAGLGKAETSTGWILAAQLALVVVYAGSFAARSFRRGWRLVVFVTVQTVAVLAIGYGGAVRLVRPEAGAALALGLASAVVAAALFAVAFTFLGDREARRHAFLYFPSLGFAFLLGGTSLLLPPTGRALTWSALALVAAFMTALHASATLGLFGVFYAAAGAQASGLLAAANHAFLAGADQPWTTPGAIGLLVLAAIGIACGFRFPRDSAFWHKAATLPKVLLLALFAWTAGGTLLAFLVPAVSGGGGGIDPAVLAALRTAVLAASALGLAWVGGFDRLREAGWLVYPALAAGGLKLMWEDFPLARPTELFVALALYGAALIFAPRLARRRRE